MEEKKRKVKLDGDILLVLYGVTASENVASFSLKPEEEEGQVEHYPKRKTQKTSSEKEGCLG